MRTLVVFVACFSAAFAQNILGNAAPAQAAPAAVAAAAAPAPAQPAAQQIPLEPIMPMGPGCRTPGGGELTTVPQNFAEVIFNCLMTDRETRGVMGFMASAQFQQSLDALDKSPDFQMLSDLLCREMYMDMNFFMTWMKNWLVAPPPPRRIPGVPRGGVHELLDLSDIPPSLMNEMLPTAIVDPHFAAIYMAYRSPAFNRIVGEVENSRAYKRIEDQLKMFNFDIQDISDFLKETLVQYRRNRRYGY